MGKTAVVSANVTDASAHAWVEVFDPDMGWQVADVTPSSGEEPEDNGLWQRILNFLGAGKSTGGSSTNGDGGQNDSEAAEQLKQTTGYVSVGIVAAVLLILIVRRLGKKVIWLICFRKGSRNDRLIMEYQRYLERIARKQNSLGDCKNYQDQLNWLDKHGYWCSDVVRLEKAVSILERAGFSRTEVTFHEYGMMRKCFRNYKKAAGKASGRKRG